MSDSTRGSGQRKGGRARLAAALNRWIWRGPNRFAREHGWEIDRGPRGSRRYRDPRFNARKKEMMESAAEEDDQGGGRFDVQAVSEPPPRRFRNHRKIPVARDLGAAAGLVWRWRAEIAMAAAMPMAAVPLLGWLGPAPTALLAAGAVLAGAGAPPVRRAAARLVLRHRFQGLCLRMPLRTPEGRLPLVVHTAGTRNATAMLVWCRSGMTPEMFEDYIPEIRVACFAKEVTIYRHHRYAHLITIELRRA